MTPQQPKERGPERSVEHCIDDGIDGRRHVAKPQADVHHVFCES